MAQRLIIMLSLVSILIGFAFNSYAEDISNLIKEYQLCSKLNKCENIEIKIIKSLLSITDIKSVLEEVPDVKDVQYKIIRCNLSGSKNDYAVEMIYNRIGYIAVLIMDLRTGKYKILPMIQTGYIFDVKTMDITGDSIEAVIITAYGTGTGYQSKWTALYKYRNFKMNLIWSGLNESEYMNASKIIEKESYNIHFMDVKGQKSKEIIQTGIIKKLDTKTNKILSENKIKKKFTWSNSKFKYIEKEDEREK